MQADITFDSSKSVVEQAVCVQPVRQSKTNFPVTHLMSTAVRIIFV